VDLYADLHESYEGIGRADSTPGAMRIGWPYTPRTASAEGCEFPSRRIDGHAEDRSPAAAGLNHDRVAERLSGLLHDVEPEAEPGPVAAAGAVESLEDEHEGR
jgi:hypothetical protein